MAKIRKSKNSAVTSKVRRGANIAVIVVICIAALLLITIAVLSGVKVNPARALEKPEYYEFYDRGTSVRTSTSNKAQAQIASAMDTMDFTIMSAILQGKWDYGYNFRRYEADDKKIEETAKAVKDLAPTSDQYMVEYIYKQASYDADGNLITSTAQSMEVDGETVYFDRVKVLIDNSNGEVGELVLYPYLYKRVDNQSDLDGLATDLYKVTGIKVRANTTKTYAALGDLANDLKLGNI